MVKHVWDQLDHAAISHKAYEQTGPMWPLTGAIHKMDVCRDLWDVVKDMWPHHNENEIGTEIRKEAEELVEAMWGKQVHGWSDCHLLIEDHMDHRAQEEGEEAMGFHVEDTDDDDSDSDYTDSFGGGDSDGDEGGGPGYQPPPSAADEPQTESPSGAACSHGPAQAVEALTPAIIAAAGLRRTEFRTEMLRKAMSVGDDPMIRSLRSALASDAKK